MKNLYTRNEFKNLENLDKLNEGLFQFMGNIFKKINAVINKVKGAKEVDVIFKEYQTIIDNEFKKKFNIDLGITAEEQLQDMKDSGKNPVKEAVDTEQKQTTQPDQTDNTEEQEKNTKLSLKTLKEKQKLIQNLINQYRDKALLKMDRVLQKMGGKEKNPKLALYIETKKDEFRLMFLNAEISALEKGGDKTTASKLAIERNKLAKEINARLDNIVKNKDVEINVGGNLFRVGVPYRYKKKDGSIAIIKISDKAKDPDEVIARYISDEMGKTELQPFRAENIDKDFTPEKGKDYNFYNSKGEIIKVKVKSDKPNDKGLVTVIGPKGGGGFMINKNTLMDITEGA